MIKLLDNLLEVFIRRKTGLNYLRKYQEMIGREMFTTLTDKNT
jgi:hypothetical protein